MNVDELLKQRYGQNRFNPSAGQTQMTFQEWMDRHPSLQGRGGDMNQKVYGMQMASPYSGPQNVTAPDYSETLNTAANNVANAGGLSGANARATGQVASAVANTPPDAPPQAANGGGSYRDFLSKRGVAGRTSTATNAAAWRRTQGKKKPAQKSTTGNKQQAH